MTVLGRLGARWSVELWVRGWLWVWVWIWIWMCRGV